MSETEPLQRVEEQLAPLRRLSLAPECEDCGALWVERGVKHWRPDGSQLCWWLVMEQSWAPPLGGL